jgi:hypothetical protein
VLRDWSDYRLHKATIHELGLARENYGDALFIHPPVFVYLSAALHHYVGVPLALVPLLLQGATLMLLPVICHSVLTACGSSVEDPTAGPHRSASVGLRAWVLLSCCPVAAFCSQKFWIDNCLMTSVTLCVAGHVCLLPVSAAHNSSKGSAMNSWLRCLISGVVFGAVGLNTKITAVALLPFSAAWIAVRHILQHANSASAAKVSLFSRVVGSTAVDAGVYLLGAAVAYSPWAYLYWVSAQWTLLPSVSPPCYCGLRYNPQRIL